MPTGKPRRRNRNLSADKRPPAPGEVGPGATSSAFAQITLKLPWPMLYRLEGRALALDVPRAEIFRIALAEYLGKTDQDRDRRVPEINLAQIVAREFGVPFPVARLWISERRVLIHAEGKSLDPGDSEWMLASEFPPGATIEILDKK